MFMSDFSSFFERISFEQQLLESEWFIKFVQVENDRAKRSNFTSKNIRRENVEFIIFYDYSIFPRYADYLNELSDEK